MIFILKIIVVVQGIGEALVSLLFQKANSSSQRAALEYREIYSSLGNDLAIVQKRSDLVLTRSLDAGSIAPNPILADVSPTLSSAIAQTTRKKLRPAKFTLASGSSAQISKLYIPDPRNIVLGRITFNLDLNQACIESVRLNKDDCHVAEYPKFKYSMKKVKRAGKTIAGVLPWTEESAPLIKEAFLIANNWRDAHAYSMRSIRYHIIYYMKKNQLVGVTAARLKRMQAIRRKLRRVPENMNQLQDLGGCRAILASIADVNSLVGTLKSKSRHELWQEDNYILNPKNDGYRSHHMMFIYRGQGAATVHNGRRIEVQIRTRLQHSWATAVEAVGLFRGEDLKGNIGSADWLQLFKLMSAEFAVAEGCPEPPDVPNRIQRVAKIRDLDRKLKASEALNNLSYAVRFTEDSVAPSSTPTYYLIKFDNEKKEVSVTPIFKPKTAVASYDNAEESDNQTGKDAENIVLVEADKLENLKEAYPNYFGDVQLFKMQLNEIVKGRSVQEYTVQPQESVAPRPRENPDLSWLKRRFRRWTS